MATIKTPNGILNLFNGTSDSLRFFSLEDTEYLRRFDKRCLKSSDLLPYAILPIDRTLKVEYTLVHMEFQGVPLTRKIVKNLDTVTFDEWHILDSKTGTGKSLDFIIANSDYATAFHEKNPEAIYQVVSPEYVYDEDGQEIVGIVGFIK